MKNNLFMLIAVICALLVITLAGGIIFALLDYTAIVTVLFVMAGVLFVLLVALVVYSYVKTCAANAEKRISGV